MVQPDPIDGWVITDQREAQAVAHLRENLKDIHDELKYQNLNTKATCLIRFLRFKKLNVTAAEKYIREALVWFKEFDPEHIAEYYEPPEAIKKYYSGGVCGVSKQGTPVYYDRLGQLDPKLVDHVSEDEVVKWEVQKGEIISRAMEVASTPTRTQYQMVNVMDLRGLGRKHWINEGMAVLKKVLFIADHYYPERLQLMLIVNAPMVFSPIWNVVKYFVSPVTRARVKIVSGDPTKLLFKYIDREHVPAYLGGDLVINGDPNCCPPILKGGKIPPGWKGQPSRMRSPGDPARQSFVLPPHILETIRQYSVANGRPLSDTNKDSDDEDDSDVPQGSRPAGLSMDEKLDLLERDYGLSVLKEDSEDTFQSFLEQSVAATVEWLSGWSETLTEKSADWSLLAWTKGEPVKENDEDYEKNTTPLKLEVPEEDFKSPTIMDKRASTKCGGCCVIS